MGSTTANSRTTGLSHAGLHAIEDYGTGKSRVSFESNHYWWNLATSFWSWEQRAKLYVEIAFITSPQKGKSRFFCRESYGHLIFYIDGMVYQHVVPAHTTVTGLYYRDVLKVIQGHIRQKWSRLSATSWMLHHNNARPHVTNFVAEYLEQINVKFVPHPHYSSDLAPYDFFSIP